MATETATNRATGILREAIVIDGMNNSRMSGEYLQSMLKGGVTAAMVPVSISTPFREAIDQLIPLLELVDQHKDQVSIIRTADDILKAKQEGKVGLVLVLEDTRQLEDDLNLLPIFRQLGIRRMQLVYTVQNSMGSGKRDRHDSGLTKLGVQTIERMQELGILIDLCHCGDRTLQEAMEVVRKPVVLSHINVRGAYNDSNNLSDDQLDEIAKNGGVVGTSAIASRLAPANPTIDHVIDHVAYVANRIGVDHVGIGLAIFEGYPQSFYEHFRLPGGVKPQGAWSWPEGMDSMERFANLTEKLLDRGYSETNTKKVLGGNYLRVFREACG